MRLLPLILAISASPAWSAAAQQAPGPSPLEGMTNAEARSLPPAELADRAFRGVAARMQSMTRPYVSPGEDDASPYHLEFATAAESAGDRGQCRATVVHIGSLHGFDTQLAEPGVLATEIVYKVVGDVDGGDEDAPWSLDQQEAQQALCARTGPVVRADAVDETQPTFFQFAGSRIPTLPLIALQRAIRGARDGSYADIACEALAAEEAPEACRNPNGLLGNLDLADLATLEISRPGQRETLYRIKARFRVVAGNQWYVTLDFDFSVGPDFRRVFRLGHAEITRGLVFEVIDGLPLPSE